MKRDRLLELRILTGTHAGARVLLPDAPQVLGSGDDCDLILCDEGLAPQHARLQVQDDGSVLLHLLDAGVDAVTIAPGQGALVGNVTIAIADADAPWLDEVPLAQAATPLADDDAATDADAQALLQPDAADATGAAPLPATGRRVRALAWMAGATLAAGLAGTVAWQTYAGRGPGAQIAAAAAPPAQASADPVAAVLAQFNLGEKVRLVQQPGKPPVVMAVLLSPDDAESLAMALSRLSPRPGLSLTSEQDLQSMVTDAVDRQSIAVERPMKARYLGEGLFRIEGRVGQAPQKQAVLEQLRTDVPQALGFEGALLTDGEALAAMIDDLHREGFTDTHGDWVDGVAQLKVQVPTADVPRWERALVAVAGRHGLPFRAALTPSGSLPGVRELALRPPDVRSIVSGAQPYVMLADGRRLMVDGSADGLRLVEVQARAVVFEAPGGRRVVVER